MAITVTKVRSREEMETVFDIRKKVFVVEQHVDPKEEYDEFETSSSHFLALVDGYPAGTSRWRFTGNGIKLERFAVLKSTRRQGVGQALVKAVLDDIAAEPEARGKPVYLHAQLPAVPLYRKFGFEREGDVFMECGIAHYTMKKNNALSLV